MSEQIFYRKASFDDIQDVSNLVRKVFDKYIAPGYSDEGCAVFYKFVEPASILESLATGEYDIWMATVNEIIIGMIGLRNSNHISLLFVDDRFHRRGIARELLRLATVKAVMNLVADITVNSSPYAVDVYRKLGFQQLEGEQLQDGIRYIPMKKQLKGVD